MDLFGLTFLLWDYQLVFFYESTLYYVRTTTVHLYLTLRKKCPYSELFWSAFSCIQTEYGVIRSISPDSVRMRENAAQK